MSLSCINMILIEYDASSKLDEVIDFENNYLTKKQRSWIFINDNPMCSQMLIQKEMRIVLYLCKLVSRYNSRRFTQLSKIHAFSIS